MAINHLGIICHSEARSAMGSVAPMDFSARAQHMKNMGLDGLARMYVKAAQGEIVASLGVNSATGNELTQLIGSLAGRFYAPAISAASVDLPIRSVIGTFDPAGLIAEETAEGAPVAPLILKNGITSIEPTKIVALLCYSRQFLELRNAATLLQHEVELAISRGLDKVFTSRLSPGSAGGVSATSSALADLREMTSLIVEQTGQNLLFGCAVDVAQRLATLQSNGALTFPLMPINGVGEILGVQTFPTDQLAAGHMLAVDPSGVSAVIQSIEVEASPSAALQLDTAPSMPAQLVSMFQSASIALRVTCRFTCEQIRATNVSASVSSIAWTTA